MSKQEMMIKCSRNFWQLAQGEDPGAANLYIYTNVEADGVDFWTGKEIKSETSAQHFREELEKLGHLIAGKSVNTETKEVAVKTAFKLSDTVLLQDIITKMPNAQERILLAFEQAEGNAPYDSIKNEEFRKFIRE